jgi:hypothetical protein
MGIAGGLLLFGAGAAGPSTDLVVSGGTADQRQLLAWAVERYAEAGFTLPPLEVRFSEDRDDCGERLGYAEGGTVWLCLQGTSSMAARVVVHELAHGWIDATLPDDVRGRFLELRGLPTWNSWDVTWDERGNEQAAEIIAWAVGDQGDGTGAPSFPANSRSELADAYRVLTGRPLPDLDPAALWVAASG